MKSRPTFALQRVLDEGIDRMTNVVVVDRESQYVAAIKKLWRANSDTLGFLPDGAFDDYFRLKHVLAAIGECGDLLGYLLFRTTRDKATIAHLCVDEAQRGKGCAALLVRHLTETTKHLRGIDLRCRRDFPVYSLWPKLGFCARDEFAGRSADGHILTNFWLDHGHPDLFSDSGLSENARRDVALDSSVFIDIVDPSQVKNEESHALLADWLQASIRLAVTEELFNDIDRQRDPNERRQRRVDAQLFHQLLTSVQAFHVAEARLRPLFPDISSEQDASDFRHLVRTLASGVLFFVTRDDVLLGRSDAVYDECGVSVLRPAEFIGRVDELAREYEYQRLQVAGTNQVFRQRVSVARRELLHAVQAHSAGEKLADIRNTAQRFLARPQTAACYAIRNESDGVLALYAIDDPNDGLLHVPLFRICAERLAGTLARSLLSQLAFQAASGQRRGILITDPYVTPTVVQAANDLGYIKVANGLRKFVYSGLWKSTELASTVPLESNDDAAARIVDLLNSDGVCSDASMAARAEHLLWPAKIEGANLPTYLVSIRAEFAKELFDEGLARQNLFGADAELALSPENVYYRAAKPSPAMFAAPGRVLWYVSASKRYDRTMAIRACSRILEVVVDKPKTLFKRFRRLGVYSWGDVLRTADGDIEKPIMAIRFDDTELLPNPIPWKDFQPILRGHGVKTQLESPVMVPKEAFDEIYLHGGRRVHSSRNSP